MSRPTHALRLAYWILATYIVLGPALKQGVGLNSRWIRSWQMFSEVGTGILKGTFEEVAAEGVVRSWTPLELSGLAHYPNIDHHLYEGRIYSDSDLGTMTESTCKALKEGHRLRFRGAIGTVEGWAYLTIEDVCGGSDW